MLYSLRQLQQFTGSAISLDSHSINKYLWHNCSSSSSTYCMIMFCNKHWESHMIFEFKIFKFWKCKDIIQTHKVQHCSIAMYYRTIMASLGCFQIWQILALFWEYLLCQALHWIVRLQLQAHSEVLHFSLASCHWSWTNTNLKDAAMNHNNNVKHLYHSLWLCPMAKNDMHFPWLEPEQVFS